MKNKTLARLFIGAACHHDLGSLPVIAQQALSRRCAHAGVGTLFSSFAGVVCVVGADRQAAEAV